MFILRTILYANNRTIYYITQSVYTCALLMHEHFFMLILCVFNLRLHQTMLEFDVQSATICDRCRHTHEPFVLRKPNHSEPKLSQIGLVIFACLVVGIIFIRFQNDSATRFDIVSVLLSFRIEHICTDELAPILSFLSLLLQLSSNLNIDGCIFIEKNFLCNTRIHVNIVLCCIVT